MKQSTAFDTSYRHVWRHQWSARQTSDVVDLVERVTAPLTSTRALDLAAGHGRHAIEMARRGAAVTAVDSCDEYISDLIINATAQNLSVEATVADILTWNAPRHAFDLVLLLGNTACMLHHGALKILFRRIADAVRPGGTLLVESWFLPELLSDRDLEPVDIVGGDYTAKARSRLALFPTRLTANLTINGPTGMEEVEDCLYLYSVNELACLARHYGADKLMAYGDCHASPFSLSSERLFLLARWPE